VFELNDDSLKRVYFTGEGFARIDCTSMKGEEEIVIKSPIKVGNSWVMKDGSKRSITAIDKDISTPLGNLKALEITTEGAESTNQEYYVKGMGFVKRVFTSKDNPEFQVITEAEKYEKNVPFKGVPNYIPLNKWVRVEYKCALVDTSHTSIANNYSTDGIIYVTMPQYEKLYLTPFVNGTRSKSSLEYNLNSSIGLDWSQDWSICYWKKPIGTHTDTLTGYNLKFRM
jgi:hypothetical protein